MSDAVPRCLAPRPGADDHHLFGVVPDAAWRRLIDDVGLERVDIDAPDAR